MLVLKDSLLAIKLYWYEYDTIIGRRDQVLYDSS